MTPCEKFNDKSKSYGKFQLFNATDGSIKILKMVQVLKISIKMKNCKTFCKVQTTNR